MLGMIFNFVCSGLAVCPVFLGSVLPFVFLSVFLRVAWWLRKQYLKGLGK